MPSSDVRVIPVIIEGIRDLIRAGQAPKSVLDVGCGFGKYGFLLREYLEVCYGRYKPEDWEVQIDAVEAFAPFRSVIHSMLYSMVHYGPLRTAMGLRDKYDVVLAIDVIEHMKRPEGLKFLERLKNLYSKELYISTPARFRSHKCLYDNLDYGQHKSFWPKEDFEEAEELYNDDWMSVYRYKGG